MVRMIDTISHVSLIIGSHGIVLVFRNIPAAAPAD